MLQEYIQQVNLVTKVLPFVAVEDCFAIKGGTAINLFELDLPRLSVDIDLTYVKMAGREETIWEINQALERIAKELKKTGVDARLRGSDNARHIQHFVELPAIRWKRQNLESLRRSNPEKFNAQRESLERLFEEGVA